MAVLGGGNVAMDSARAARRLGAEVHVVYRRGKAEMPAREEEAEHAEEEGVILTAHAPVHDGGRGWPSLTECRRMELGEPDATGRRRPVEIPGSEFLMDIDASVCAIGNSPNPLIAMTTPGLEVGKRGNIVADDDSGRHVARQGVGRRRCGHRGGHRDQRHGSGPQGGPLDPRSPVRLSRAVAPPERGRALVSRDRCAREVSTQGERPLRCW